MCAALAEFGFVELGKAASEFATEQRMVSLGHEPLRVDVMTSIDGVSFEEGWSGSLEASFGEHAVRFLGRAELIRNKKASGRPKDLLDIALLEEGADSD